MYSILLPSYICVCDCGEETFAYPNCSGSYATTPSLTCPKCGKKMICEPIKKGGPPIDGEVEPIH